MSPREKAVSCHRTPNLVLFHSRLPSQPVCFKKSGMQRLKLLLPALALVVPMFASAQIDPVKRDLIQLGYNQPLEGQAPVGRILSI